MRCAGAGGGGPLSGAIHHGSPRREGPFVRVSLGALSEIWGELQRAAGATERLVEILNDEDRVEDPMRALPVPDLRSGARWRRPPGTPCR